MKHRNFRVAIYARVSTNDKGQDSLNQLLQLREFAKKQGWKIVSEYVDEQTAKTASRPKFNLMWLDAEAHRFDCLLFWSLDRFTREGTLATLNYLRRLKDHGIAFKSYTEQYIDSLGIFSEAIIGILGAIAAQERIRLSDRTRAGLARVKAQGKKLGRPHGSFKKGQVSRTTLWRRGRASVPEAGKPDILRLYEHGR